MSVCVLGSMNVDHVVRVHHIPAPGETVPGCAEARYAGGKGNNQAIAAARSGASVVFIGAVGRDDPAALLLALQRDAGIDARVRTTEATTGTAWITIAEDGENAIVVIPGANSLLLDLTDVELELVRGASVLLLQQEIPLPTAAAAAATARAAGGVVVLNAAPSVERWDGLLDVVDLVIVNEQEAADLTGGAHRPPEEALGVLLERVPAAVVTLGRAGALVGVRGQKPLSVPAYSVPAEDTTGAGDTFCGALVAELDRGGAREVPTAQALGGAVRFATAAAALSVQRTGAADSSPWRQEVLDALVQ